MSHVPLSYLARRLAIFALTILLSATIVYAVPRLAPGDPVAATIARLTSDAGYVEGAAEMVRAWQERLGLLDPWYVQYLRFLKSAFTLDFGPSLVAFPTPVSVIIARALPWTIGLLLTATIIAFLLGNIVGALLAWDRTPRCLRAALPLSLVFTSLPAVLAAVFLLYIFSATLGLLPAMEAYSRDVEAGLNFAFVSSVVTHAILPALSIILVTFGTWALSMRGMLVTISGEDYTTLARAVGFHPLTILFRYMVRNALLPQLTGLALAVGNILSGAVLVEAVFNYPGMGSVLVGAIRNQDFSTIQGSALILIATAATAVLILDLIYPLIDPRIRLR